MNIKYIRPIIYVSSIVLSLLVYAFFSAQNSYLIQAYALIAVVYLYFTLLASPLYAVFPRLAFKGQYIFARRALGVSAFFFAFLHVYYAFFIGMGGFEGLKYLNAYYFVAVMAGFIAYLILLILAATSFDLAVQKLSYKYWKMLHRLVYLASFLILVHALMMGSHFNNLNTAVPFIFYPALLFLLVLEGIRMKKHLTKAMQAKAIQT